VDFAQVLREISGPETLNFDDLYHSRYLGRWHSSDREKVER
jgi:hypothetical protein